MPNIELLLRSSLMKDALSAVLTGAGFAVSTSPNQYDEHATVVIDFDDCRNPETIRTHQQRGVKIVALANEGDSMEMDHDQLALLSGILTHSLSVDTFAQALRLICAGERVFPRDLALGPKLPAPSPGTKQRSDPDRLSQREREVLAQLVAGHSNKVIAWRLGVAEATVKVHLKSLLRKIQVDNRTQAAIWAASNLPELDLAPSPRGFV